LTRSRAAGWTALAFAMVFPSIAAWLYFVAYSGKPAMGVIYPVAKTIQFSFPVAWLVLVAGERVRLRKPSWEGTLPGMLFGLFAAAVILLVYAGYLRGTSLIAATPAALAEKVKGLGVSTPAQFVLLGAFMSLVHSLLEEYYWRWFVFGQLQRYIAPVAAILVSSLAFTAHHVIVLAAYFGAANWPLIVLFACGVAAGGAFWAWLYWNRKSLGPVWTSHVLVDISLMLIGFDLLWPGYANWFGLAA
jgi:uncharacterized protein